MSEILTFLRDRAKGDLLAWENQLEAAQAFGIDLADVERIILENGLLPARYQRNRKMLGIAEQLKLFSSQVVVVGCGGLGGYIIEELARLGVGRIVAVDPDVFEEHNLNRQLYSSPVDLGRSKVEVAAERVAKVNPAVSLTAVAEAFGKENGLSILLGADIAVDALDSRSARVALASLGSEVGIPVVHGAIAGWYGQVTTLIPGEAAHLFLNESTGEKGVEQEFGNPAFTPAVVASLQVAEVCKVLLGEGEPLRGRALMIDLREMDFMETLSLPVSCDKYSSTG